MAGVAFPFNNLQFLQSQSGLYSSICNRLSTHSKPDQGVNFAVQKRVASSQVEREAQASSVDLVEIGISLCQYVKWKNDEERKDCLAIDSYRNPKQGSPGSFTTATDGPSALPLPERPRHHK